MKEYTTPKGLLTIRTDKEISPETLVAIEKDLEAEIARVQANKKKGQPKK